MEKSLKHKCLRMCIACKQLRPKNELLKITKTKNGELSLELNVQGRGAYICRNVDCINKSINRRLLNKTFKANVSNNIYDELNKQYGGITEQD